MYDMFTDDVTEMQAILRHRMQGSDAPDVPPPLFMFAAASLASGDCRLMHAAQEAYAGWHSTDPKTMAMRAELAKRELDAGV